MGKTISTHNGSQANREHNIRNPKATDKQEHIDKTLKSRNEILHDEKPRDAYERIFGEALAKYNANQDRPERRIKSYFNHVDKDAKKHPVYEMIVQIGNREDTGIDAPTERECLLEFYDGWKERNPNLECIGAYLHADENEGTLHMHIDYVPVAHGYKRGLETQNGLVKALGEQGFEKSGKSTAQIQWEARENATLEQIALEHGIEVDHPEVEKRNHMATSEYKLTKELARKEKILGGMEKKIEKITKELSVARDDEKNGKADLQKQNRALKVQTSRMESEIEKLKSDLAQEKAKAKQKADKVHDRNSIERKSLDAYSKQALFERYRKDNAALNEHLIKFDKQIESLDEYAYSLKYNKEQYVVQAKLENGLLKDLKSLSEKESLLKDKIKALEPILNDVKRIETNLSGLEQKNAGFNPIKRMEQTKAKKDLISANAELQNTLKKYLSFDESISSDDLAKEIDLIKSDLKDTNLIQNKKQKQLEEATKNKNEHYANYSILTAGKKILLDESIDYVDRVDKEYEPPKEHQSINKPNTFGVGAESLLAIANTFPNIMDADKQQARINPPSRQPKKRSKSKSRGVEHEPTL